MHNPKQPSSSGRKRPASRQQVRRTIAMTLLAGASCVAGQTASAAELATTPNSTALSEPSLTLLNSARRVQASDTASTQTTTIAPTAQTGTLTGPARGQYLWFPDSYPTVVPSGQKGVDRYLRLPWRALEPSPHQYDFSLIDEELQRAAAERGTFSFRVLAVCGGCDADSLPSDVSALPTSWTSTGVDADARIPDWNDQRVIARWGQLMKALGARFNGNPRLGYVDVGGYGNWGEGHNYPYSLTYPRPTGQREGTKESIAAYAAAVTAAFPNTTVLYNPPEVMRNGSINGPDSWYVLRAALLASPKVGIRNDCLGGGTVQESAVSILNDAQRRAVAEGLPASDQPLGRWQKAPFVTEWCGNIAPGSTDGTFAKGAEQVRQWHVSSVSNGNFSGAASEFSPTEISGLRQASIDAGYRLGVSKLVVSDTPLKDVQLKATWTNKGVAPTYRPWRVTYSLISADGRVASTATSTVDLRSLLGSGSSVQDAASFAGTRSMTGRFTVRVAVEDDAGVYAPMPLENGTRGSAGEYALGSVTLR